MNSIIKTVFIFLIFFYPVNSFSQNYWIINKNEEIKLTILSDSIQIQITNKSEKSIFLPVEKVLKQSCSVDKSSINIQFGVDLKVFNEVYSIELLELRPDSTRVFKQKLLDCNYNKYVYFIYQFYQKFFINYENKKIFNSDFVKKDDWLINGNWEWGEIIIDLKK